MSHFEDILYFCLHWVVVVTKTLHGLMILRTVRRSDLYMRRVEPPDPHFVALRCHSSTHDVRIIC